MKTNRVTVPELRAQKQRGEKIVMLTAYDATFARLLDQAGADILLVGDSVGMVVAGYENTLPVTMDEMLYHCRAVARGTKRAHIVGDMPFMSYQVSIEQGLSNAARMLKEGGCHAVKLEGGAVHAPLVSRLVECGIPVMGHIGLLPQSVHQQGGFKVQGREQGGDQRLLQDALALQQAGAYSIVIEGVPHTIAKEISRALSIPTIGIGAGAGCDGQVLVIYDLLGMNDSFQPKFVRRFESLADKIRDAVTTFGNEVRAGSFPSEQESFGLTSSKASASVDATPYSSAATKPL
jgi:3-methyl-2-oxobutanoate hydroxymethyltransferase